MKLELQVAGMHCGHCVRAVTAAVRTVDPQAQVAVDLDGGRVSVDTSAARDAVAAAIADAGYEVCG